jgi:hypothetical protein
MARKTESMQPKTIFAVLLFLAATCCGAESVEDIRIEEILQSSAGAITRVGEIFVYHKVLEDYILRYDTKEKRLAIVSRETPTRVQELGDIVSLEDVIPVFYSIDINMDGFSDIAYRTDCVYNCASAYLVFDPESARFIPNAVDLFVQDIAFDADARIFTLYQSGGIGHWVASVYAPDGQHFPVFQEYSRRWPDDEYLENEESAYSRFKLALAPIGMARAAEDSDGMATQAASNRCSDCRALLLAMTEREDMRRILDNAPCVLKNTPRVLKNTPPCSEECAPCNHHIPDDVAV